VLFALGQPIAFVGLLLAFVLALTVRAYAIRITGRSLGLTARGESVTPRLREDVDPFGAVAAAVGGAGWGKTIDVDEVPRFRGRGRAATVFAAGPVAILIISQLLLLAFRLAYPGSFSLSLYRPSDVLHGQIDEAAGAEILLSLAIGFLAFGLLALIPIPPLDGFGLLWLCFRRPGPGLQGYRLWFVEKNLGVVILLAACFFPLSAPLLLVPIDLIGGPLMRLWSV
jgi:Zn-dependent protease